MTMIYKSRLESQVRESGAQLDSMDTRLYTYLIS